MDKIERIRTELKRRREDILSKVHHLPIHRIELLDDLLSFINTLSEEPDKSLEEAAEEYATDTFPITNEEYVDYSRKSAFIAGAEWQKQQMLKDAVEADVMLTLHDKTGDISLHTGYLPKELGIKCDDKVRIVVLKAEEE